MAVYTDQFGPRVWKHGDIEEETAVAVGDVEKGGVAEYFMGGRYAAEKVVVRTEPEFFENKRVHGYYTANKNL